MEIDACVECGNPKGANPKFCSRSCAAKYNNARSPKRRPEGRCEHCGQPAPTAKRLCSTCKPIVEAANEARSSVSAQNIRTWLGPAGEENEAAIWSVHLDKEMIFSSRLPGGAELDSNAPSSELIDWVIGICFAGPEYVRKCALPRYISLLADLKAFTFDCPYDRRLHGKSLSQIKLEWLSLAASQWIKSWFSRECHPLMPSYALDVARFLEFHAEGDYGHSDVSWRLAPLLGEDRGGCGLMRFLSPTFKKEFTQAMGQILVAAEVPSGARIVQDHETVAEGGTTVVFLFKRCHLSESTADYYDVSMSVDDPTAPTFDLMSEFCFTGSFVVHGESAGYYHRLSAAHIAKNLVRLPSELPAARHLGFVGGTLPAEWITHVIEVDPYDRPKPPQLIPIPKWRAELD